MGVVETYARELLAVQPSQVSSERIFNTTKAVNLNRQSMTPARMQRFVISTMNMKKLTAATSRLALEEARDRALEPDFLLDEASRIGMAADGAASAAEPEQH